VSPYLTSREALVYLRLPSLSALYHHIHDNALPVCRVGGDLRFDTRELDAWMRGTTALELVRARRRA
jgi:excisionase family DNA binding protein